MTKLSLGDFAINQEVSNSQSDTPLSLEDFKTKEGAEILGTLNSMSGASDLARINAYRDFWYHPEHGKFNSSTGQSNFEEILKQYNFDRPDAPNKMKRVKLK